MVNPVFYGSFIFVRIIIIRFIIPKKSKNDIGFHFAQVILTVSKTFVCPGPVVNLISGVTQVPEYQTVLWIPHLDITFDPSFMLHSLGKRIANDGNTVSSFKFEGDGIVNIATIYNS